MPSLPAMASSEAPQAPCPSRDSLAPWKASLIVECSHVKAALRRHSAPRVRSPNLYPPLGSAPRASETAEDRDWDSTVLSPASHARGRRRPAPGQPAQRSHSTALPGPSLSLDLACRVSVLCFTSPAMCRSTKTSERPPAMEAMTLKTMTSWHKASDEERKVKEKL